MGTLQFRLALALVAGAALILAGCPDPQGKDDQSGVNKEAKPAVQPAPAAVAVVEQAPPEDRKAEQPACGDGPKPAANETLGSQDKWGFTSVEKAWGLKLKSVAANGGNYTLVVEFGKDLTAEELQVLGDVFPRLVVAVEQPKVAVYYFDKDNVVEEKTTNCCQSLTEMTGVKGDAFRLRVPAPANDKSGVVVRAEFRIVEPLISTAEMNIKVEKSDVEVAPDAKKTIPVTAGKATKVEVEPADSKVKATIEAGKVTIDAKDAKDGDKATVKVTGSKGTVEVKVRVRK